jgi:hypothetical protein
MRVRPVKRQAVRKNSHPMRPDLPLLALLLTPLAVLQVASAQGIERPDAPLREMVPGLRIEVRPYPEHGATEWQSRLRAPAAEESPLYENLKSADFEVAFPSFVDPSYQN